MGTQPLRFHSQASHFDYVSPQIPSWDYFCCSTVGGGAGRANKSESKPLRSAQSFCIFGLWLSLETLPLLGDDKNQRSEAFGSYFSHVFATKQRAEKLYNLLFLLSLTWLFCLGQRRYRLQAVSGMSHQPTGVRWKTLRSLRPPPLWFTCLLQPSDDTPSIQGVENDVFTWFLILVLQTPVFFSQFALLKGLLL